MSSTEGNNNDSYSNSSISRPPQLDGGGGGLYCCVPHCKNASYDRFMQKTNIGFFTFPDEEKQPELRQQWTAIIKKYRRKGHSDSFRFILKRILCFEKWACL